MPKKKPTIQGDRVLPYCVEAENAVISSIIVNPDLYPDVRAIISADDFQTIQAKECFAAIDKLWPGVDQLTVSREVRDDVRAGYLSQIIAELPTSVNAVYYARIVAHESFRRRMIDAAGKIAAIAYEGESDSESLFLAAQDILNNTEPQSNEDMFDGPAIAELIVTMVSQRLLHTENISLPFGYRDLDALTGGGMYPGNMVVLGARPGVGKSQLLVEVGRNARYMGRSVMIASAEMKIEEWLEREIAMETGISVKDQRAGVNRLECTEVAGFASTVSRQQHYWLKDPVTISRIVNKARVLKRTSGLDLLIVDYIQLICDSVGKEHGTTGREKVGYISRTLKRLAKDLDIKILVAAQLNRDIEHRANKLPLMSDFREAGDIEQDADVIVLLHRPSLYDKKDEPNITQLIVPKIRQIGKTGIIRLVWREEVFKHDDIHRGEDTGGDSAVV